MAFDITKAGFGVQSMAKVTSVVKIPLDRIENNEKNFYGLRDIDTLAESIKMEGLISPVIVMQTAQQEYRIISGHRRYAAFSALAEQDDTYRTIPAIIVKSMADVDESLMLIFSNSTTRELTYSEKLMQEKVLRESLQAVKEAGGDVPKKLGAYMAEKLGTSRNEVSRMHSVNENLIDAGMDLVQAGEMNAKDAYELSRKTPGEQSEIIRTRTEKNPVAEHAEQIAKDYLVQYDDEMKLLDEALEKNLYVFIGDGFQAENRADLIAHLKTVWKTASHAGNGFDFAGSANGVSISGNGKTADIRWTDLTDHVCLAAINAAVNAPAQKPEIIRETVYKNSWNTGNPEVPGEYVAVFSMSGKEFKRFCNWTGAGWEFQNGTGIAMQCTRWIALPEV